MKKIHITTLGCSKNIVDSEVLTGQLETNQFVITKNPQDAEVIIINTCGFINDAKEESIQTIFEALKLREKDPNKKVYVAGCLTQRYREEISKEIPEIDGIFGTEAYGEILDALGKNHAAADNLHLLRRLSTPGHFAYLKISEGCNHACAFCAIPNIRGKFRSRSMDSLLDEAQMLADKGVKELILISQDSSYYGLDFISTDSPAMPELLKSLEQIDGIQWIRPLYWYPKKFPMEVIHLMRDSKKILPYLDLPLQHISDNQLRLMRRPDTRQSILQIISTIREQIPHAALRTTLILGFPGESNADFEELYRFVEETRFDRLGTFVYSDEENTAAYDLPDKINPEIARERQDKIMELQRSISLEKNRAMIGQVVDTIIDEYVSEQGIFIGRTYRDAPEIDNEVIIAADESQDSIKQGDIIPVSITDAGEYEIYGVITQTKKNRTIL